VRHEPEIKVLCHAQRSVTCLLLALPYSSNIIGFCVLDFLSLLHKHYLWCSPLRLFSLGPFEPSSPLRHPRANMPASTPNRPRSLGHDPGPPGTPFTVPAIHLLDCTYCAVALDCTIVLYFLRNCALILHDYASPARLCFPTARLCLSLHGSTRKIGSGLAPASWALDLFLPYYS
jgi:hypothetical protein